jgi:hypothetical protein
MSTRWKPNVTVAAIIEREGRFMLVEEHTSEGLRLNNPAGHLDCGETPEQACAREALRKPLMGSSQRWSAYLPRAGVRKGQYLPAFAFPATGPFDTSARWMMASCARCG